MLWLSIVLLQFLANVNLKCLWIKQFRLLTVFRKTRRRHPASMKFPSHIKIGTLPAKHIIALNETIGSRITFIGGIDAEIINIISIYLHFTYDLLVPKDREWGMLRPDGNWSGLIGMVNRSEVDMAISFLSITDERSKAVDYVFYHSDASSIIVNTPSNKPNILFFVNTFSTGLWVSCILVLLAMSYAFCLLKKNSSFHVVVLQMAGIFFNQSPNAIRCQTTKQRYFLEAWNIFARLMTLSYSAVLFSFMTVPIRDRGIETFKDLATAVSKGTYKFYIPWGTSVHESLRKSADDSLRYITHMAEENGWISDGESIIATKPNSQELKNIAGINSRTVYEMDHVPGLFQNTSILGDVEIWHTGIAVRRSFCCTKELQITVDKVNKAGLYEKFYNNEKHKATFLKYKHYVSQTHEESVNMAQMHGTFYLLLAGYALSALLLVSEVVVQSIRKIC